MSPLVSIIIPSFNSAPFVEETVQSALGQTWGSIEVIVVDDGSTDGTRDVLRRFESKCNVIFQSNQGAAAARNRGLKDASGEFIQFLDADDVLDSRKIEVQMRALGDAPAGSIASGAWRRFKGGPGETLFEPEPVWRNSSGIEFLSRSWLGGGMMPVFAWLAPREIIERAGRWDETISVNDDGEYFTRVILAAAGIIFCKEAKGYYRAHATTSLSRRSNRGAALSDFKSIDQSCKHLLARDNSSAAKAACAAAYQRFAFRYYPDYEDLTAMAEKSVVELGGSDLPYAQRPVLQAACSIIGWKATKKLQALMHARARFAD